MNKLFIFLGLLVSSFGLFNETNHSNIIAKAESDTYFIDSFSELPSNWELYSRSETNSNTLTFNNNEMVIKANGSGSNTSYYGSVYRINTDKNYGDFTFEISAKMVNPADDNRWLGIGYHTQDIAESMVGYLMNYRYNGNSAFSAFNTTCNFWDGEKVNVNVPLNDGKFHKFKIVLEGTTSKHYIDDKLITSWNIKDRDSHFTNGTLSSGGFALFVNRSTVHINSVAITGELVEVENNTPSTAIKDETLANTYYNSANTNFPTVVVDVNSKSILDTLPQENKNPSNAILHIDEKMNVVDKDGTILDTFNNVYTNNLSKKIIPVVYLENIAHADALSKYLHEEKYILDMAVMSNNASLVKKIKEKYPALRGVVEYSDETNVIDIVPDLNKNYGLVAVVSQEYATPSNVRYIHARFKTVWVRPNSETKIDLYNTINSETYGIIVEDYDNLYEVYSDYDYTSLTRMPFNVAHRGIPTLCNENSVEGTKKSIEVGATHIELDAYLTTDGKVAIMHDSTIDRTSNGSGSVEDMSLAELQKYQLDQKQPYEKIPSLKEISVPIKESDAVLVLEIKSSKLDIIEAIKNDLTELDMLDHTVVISFNSSMIYKMKEILPEIPTALLGNFTMDASLISTLGNLNTVADTNSANINFIDNMVFYRDRGFSGWAWTYTTEMVTKSAVAIGIMGITNNVADFFSDQVVNIKGIPFTLGKNETITKAEYYVTATYYTGEVRDVIGDLFYYEEFDDYYEVICKYELNITGTDITTIYSQSFKVEKYKGGDEPDNPGDTPNTSPTTPPTSTGNINSDNENNGCASCGNANINIVTVLSLITILGLAILKRK